MTEKQKRFAEEYLIDLNASAAAIRAGYSPDSAGNIGSENLKKPEIKAYIERAMAERSKRTGITADRVLGELAKIAFCSLADLTDETGALLDGVSRDDMAAVAAIKTREIPTRGGKIIVEREIRMADKIKALELCGKHVGLFKDAEIKLSPGEGAITVRLEGEIAEWAK